VFHEHGLNNPIHTRTLGPCGAKDATCEVGKGKLKGFCNCWGAGATKEMGAKTGNAFGMTFGEIRKYVNAAGETVGPLVKGAQRGVRDMHSSIYTSVVAEVRTNRCFTTKQFGTQEVPTAGPERGTNRMTFSGKWEVTAGPEMCGVCRDTVSTISLLPWATRGSLAWDFVVGDHCVAMEGFYNSKISGTDYKPNTLYKERNDKIKTLLATCPGSKITSWYPENEKCSELFPEKATWTAGAWNPTVTRGAVFEGEVPLSGKLSIGVEGTLLYGWDKGFVGFESTGKGVTISGKSTIASSGLTGIMVSYFYLSILVHSGIFYELFLISFFFFFFLFFFFVQVGNCYNVVIDKNTDPWTYTAEESSSTNSRACMSMFLQTTVPECQDSNMNDQQKAMNLFLNEKGVGMVCEAAKEDKRKYNVKNCPQPDSRFDNLREDCNSDCRTWCCPNCVESYVGEY